MSKKHRLIAAVATVGLACIGLGSGAAPQARASSHREAPAIAQDPAADNTDIYAWVNSGTHSKLNVVLCFNPFEEPSGGPNFNEFSTEVLYELHLTRGADSLADVFTYQFTFTKTPVKRVDTADLTAAPGGGKEFFSQLSGQSMTMRVTKIANGQTVIIADAVPVAPPNIGPFTYTNFQKGSATQATYDDAFAATFVRATTEGGNVWAGPRDDGFYVDLGGVFDAAQLRTKGVALNGLAGYNVHAISIEIPTTSLTASGQAPGNAPSDANLIGVWGSTSRREINFRLRNGQSFSFGPWVQVSRLGLPLINEAVIGLQDKDRWNASRPTQESYFFPYFLNPILVRDAEAVGIYKAKGVDPTMFKTGRTDIIDAINLKNIPTMGAHNVPLTATGDVLRVDIGTDSAFPNGRPLVGGTNKEQADVTDVLLSLILTKQLTGIGDGVDYNDATFLSNIPWLALPWRGYDQGHGKATP